MEGNQQKMREAVEEIIEKIDAWRTDGTMEHWQYSQLFDIADAALALPLRQCDVGTAEEQVDKFGTFCISNKTTIPLPEKCTRCRIRGEANVHKCMFEWAQLPYTAEEGAGK